MTEKVNILLAPNSEPRDGTGQTKDPYILNGLIETDRRHRYIVRRAGIDVAFTAGAGAAVTQGLFFFNGFFYLVANDILYRTSGPTNSATDGAAFSSTTTPPWAKRFSPQAVVFQDRIYLMGAGVDTNNISRGDVWSTPDGLNWTLNTSGSGASRNGHRCCVFNGAIYMIAGFQSVTGTVLSDVLMSTDGTNWTQVTNTAPWGPRAIFGLVATNNGIFLFGGTNGVAPQNDVWFTPDGATWNQVNTAAPWAVRSGMGALYFNNLIWCVGGAGALFYNDVWSSPDGIVWTRTTAAAFDTGRSGMGMAVYNNKMWALGGTSGLNTARVFSTPDGITWTQVTAGPGWSARQQAAVVAFKTPNTVSPYRYPSLWLISGGTPGFENRDVWYGNINTSTSVSFPLTPTTTGQFYQFATYMNGTKLVLKNQSNFWVLDAGTLIKVIDSSYPTVTVPGLAVLDAFVHVCTPEAEVHSCQLDDATIWPSLQFLTADYEDDPAVAMVKHLNYVVVFGTYTVQFFYDAGNPTGTELLPYQSATQRYGCFAARTVVQMGNTVIFVCISQDGRLQAAMLNGITVTIISTVYVERWLQETGPTTISAFPWVSGGHNVYVVGDGVLGTGQMFAYDFSTKVWSEWSLPIDFNNNYLAFSISSGSGTQYVMPSGATVLTTPTIYSVDAFNTNDAGTPFTVTVQTEKEDAGQSGRKFWGRTTLLCDQTASSTTTTISTTDDDYQTFVPRGSVNESSRRPFLHGMGSSNTRAWLISRTDSLPLRWRELEVEFSKG